MRRMKSFRHPSSNKSIKPPDGLSWLFSLRVDSSSICPYLSASDDEVVPLHRLTTLLQQLFGRTLEGEYCTMPNKQTKIRGRLMESSHVNAALKSQVPWFRIINKYPAVPTCCMDLISQPRIPNPKNGIQSSIISNINNNNKSPGGKMAPKECCLHPRSYRSRTVVLTCQSQPCTGPGGVVGIIRSGTIFAS